MKPIRNISILLALWASITYTAMAQHDIKFTIENYDDTIGYLLYYYKDKTIVLDTLSFEEDKALYHSDTALHQGIYIIADATKQRRFEFMLGKSREQNFHISDDIMRCFCDDEESALLLRHQQMYYLSRYYKGRSRISDSIDMKLTALTDSIIAIDSTMFLSVYLKALQEPIIPDSIIASPKNSYTYYKDHYWDTYDWGDKRLLYTALPQAKLNNYYDKILAPIADTIIAATDRLLKLAPKDSEVRDYLLWYLLLKFQHPIYMGHDKVLVHLSEHYFLKEPISGLDIVGRQYLEERIAAIKGLLLGAVIDDIELIDITDKRFIISNLEEPYTIIFFSDHSCDRCQEEAKILKTMQESDTIHFNVIQIEMNYDTMQSQYHNGYSWRLVHILRQKDLYLDKLFDVDETPMLYLLDNERRIIGKHFEARDLSKIIKMNKNDRKQNH